MAPLSVTSLLRGLLAAVLLLTPVAYGGAGTPKTQPYAAGATAGAKRGAGAGSAAGAGHTTQGKNSADPVRSADAHPSHPAAPPRAVRAAPAEQHAAPAGDLPGAGPYASAPRPGTRDRTGDAGPSGPGPYTGRGTDRAPPPAAGN